MQLKSQLGRAHLSVVPQSTVSVIPTTVAKTTSRRSPDNEPLWAAQAVSVLLPAGGLLKRRGAPCIYTNVGVGMSNRGIPEHIIIRVLGVVDDLDLAVANIVTGVGIATLWRTSDGDRCLCLSIQRFATPVEPTCLALIRVREPKVQPYGWNHRIAHPHKQGLIDIIDLQVAYRKYRVAA